MSQNEFEDKKTQVFDDEKALLLNHDYDGIQELDNPLPMWWLWTFFAAIIFSFMYFLHYHLDGGGLSQDESVAIAIKEVNAQRALAKSKVKTLTHDEFVARLNDSARLENGKAVFAAYCASCHGQMGEGNIGPNLTDTYWKIADVDMPKISSIVRSGIPNTGMPPWEAILNSDQIEDVTIYVESLKGSNPPNPKKPEGTDQG